MNTPESLIQNAEQISKSKHFAQVHSPVGNAVLRVEFEEGDTVGELIETVCARWGIADKKGWFPMLVEKSDWGWQLHRDDPIPTDVKSFVQRHEKEFETRGGAMKPPMRAAGDIMKKPALDVKASGEELPSDWNTNDIHIEFAVAIIGG